MSDVAHTDALAAEYVLGTLNSDEREQARALLGTDAAFAVKVSQWERRLGELHLMVEPVEPDAGIWARIKSKMPEAQQRSNVRLPEAHIPEPAPATIPTEAPSLDAIEATISETALALTSEAAAAPAWEPAEAPASEAVARADIGDDRAARIGAGRADMGHDRSAGAGDDRRCGSDIGAGVSSGGGFGRRRDAGSAGERVVRSGGDRDGDLGRNARARLARDANSGSRRRARGRSPGGAAGTARGDHPDAGGDAEDGRDCATGRGHTPEAATLARICDPDDARGRGSGRTSRGVEVCARACPARVAAV